MSKPEIPKKTVYRLAIYHRALLKLKANGVETVSSAALAAGASVKDTQLRKDLAYLGTVGTRGRGYPVEELSRKISDKLGTARLQPVILVGAGHLGSALLRYSGFAKEGFGVVAAFDLHVTRQRSREISVPLFPMEKLRDYIKSENIKLAILTVPVQVAQEVANELVAAGVQGILNFAPVILQVPDTVQINNVDLAIELENLSYFVK